MSLSSVFAHRVRGFRVVELVGVGVLLSLVLGVYMAKTFAGRERAEIASVERQIEDEKIRIRLLQAEVAHLEQPRRIEGLAASLNLEPIAPERETSEEALIDVARHGASPAAAPVSPSQTPSEALAADAPQALPADAAVAEAQR